jgi:putative lipoprotein (rSAM/lipoprotein system)
MVRAQRGETAIPGIALSLLDTLTSYGISDTVTSDAAGRYIISFTGNPDRNTWVLRAWDRDGPENGDFLPADTVIAIAREQLSGGDGCWYAGAAEREIDVRLARKQ